jgi:TonB-dependent receptor
MVNSRKRALGASMLRFSLGVALTALCAPAIAQTTDPAAAEAESGDDIIVRGSRPIAESEAAALEAQRASDSLISVAASDSVGRLPDQNIAQAAGRLPGVAVQRDQGQARYISLRGAPITWATLSIDGITVVSPEGRDTRYDSIPSATASQIVVRKAVTPDLTGETIAGNIDIVTRSPFDYSGTHVAGKLGAGVVEYGSRQEYEGSLVLSDRFDLGGGELGLLVSGSYYQRDMITDNFEIDWEPVAQDLQPGFQDRIWARETENKLYRLTRRNWSVSGRLEYRPDGGEDRIFAQSIYTIFTDDEARDNFIFDMDDRQSDNNRGATPCTITTTTSAANTGYADVCIGNTPFTGTIYGIDINQRATLRAFRQSIFTNTLGGHFALSDSTDLDFRLNYTRSEDDRSVVGEARFDSPSTRTLRPTIAYDFTDPQLARYNLFTTLSSGGLFSRGMQTRDIDVFPRPLSSLRSLDAVDVTDAYTARLDLTNRNELFGAETTLQFGVRFDQRTKESNESELLANSAARFTAAALPTSYEGWWNPQLTFQGRIPLSYDFRYFDIRRMRQFVEQLDAVQDFTPIPANFYNVREQVYAGYAMATVRTDWGSILGGVRVEHVRNQGEAFVLLGGVQTLIRTEGESTLAFPSLHFNYNVGEDHRIRLSFNSGAARPDYDQLRPNFTFSDSNLTISGGNPLAKPERAYGADLYYEYYIQPQGYFSVGVYYKRAEDVLFDDTRVFNSDVLNFGGIDRSQYVLSTITNGGSGYLYGIEAALQLQLDPWTDALGLPEWMGGFGINANISLNESEAEAPDGSKIALPGTSDIVYNIGGYYEKYGLSIRLNYQYRSEWIDGYGPAADGGNFFWAADDELDFSARYALTPNFEVYFDASNLLNGSGRRYVRDSRYTIEWERFGRRYTGGVRFTF